jgi:hypothetical protein
MSENEMIQAFIDRRINIWVPNLVVTARLNDLLKPYNRNFLGGFEGVHIDGVEARVIVLVDWDTRIRYSSDWFPKPPTFYRELPVYVYRGDREETFIC